MRWTEEDIVFLEKHYLTGSEMGMVKQLNRSWGAIRKKANDLSLKRRRQPIVIPAPLNLSEAEAAYSAGIIDGEGCIAFFERKTDGYRALFMNCRNTNETLILWLKEKLKIPRKIVVVKDPRPTRKPNYVIITADMGIILRILTTTKPYLIVKKERAEIAIEWTKLQMTKLKCIPYSQHEDALYRRMKSLNIRGKRNGHLSA